MTSNINDLRTVLRGLPLQTFCKIVHPEFGVKWNQLSEAIRSARLPMTSLSVAQVLCKHVARHYESEEIGDMVRRMKLKLITTKPRTWHVIKLSSRILNGKAFNVLRNELPNRIKQALNDRKRRPGWTAEVETIQEDDLTYISVRMNSFNRRTAPLYVATPLGEPVALVSSLKSTLIKSVILGIGYEEFEDACLSGGNIESLLRIINEKNNRPANFLAQTPSLSHEPVITEHGIDYTSRDNVELYVRAVLGPSPPVLEQLTVTYEKDLTPRFGKKIKIKMTMQIKSENLAEFLVNAAVNGGLDPTSDFFHIIHDVKANKLVHTDD